MKKLLIAYFNMKRTMFCFILLISYHSSLISQNVAINSTGAAAAPSAGLDISFPNKGMLMPRMTTTQMNAITSPAKGLQVFDTTTNCLMLYSGNTWQSIFCACTAAPNTPGAITGSATVCSGESGVIYSIVVVSGANSYTWSVPTGASITMGQGTTSITVTFGSASGNISVTATNSCGTSAANTLAITVNTVPTSVTASVSPNPVCAGNTLTFTGSATGATSWSWSGPDSFTSAIQNPDITGVITAAAGTYTLTASNVCGSATPVTTASVTVNAVTHGSAAFSYTGAITSWTVPLCVVSVTIQAYGAQGGIGWDWNSGTSGGDGAYVTGTFSVTSGNAFGILAGQQGTAGWWGGGGGGGSFVWNTSASNTLLIAAGGGGGGGDYSPANGGAGQATATPGTGSGTGSATGGTNGSGGTGGALNQQTYGTAGGGAGWLGNGGNGTNGTSYGNGDGGYSPLNGGAGGTSAPADAGNNGPGGFGGGGGGAISGGGGGGYNGGGGGNGWNGSNGGGGGGGGSYIINTATNTSGSSGYQSGNGQVIITW